MSFIVAKALLRTQQELNETWVSIVRNDAIQETVALLIVIGG